MLRFAWAAGSHSRTTHTWNPKKERDDFFFYFKRKSRTNSKEGKRVSHTHSTGGIMKLRKKTSHLLREITIHNFLEARASEHISHTLLSQPTEAGLLCVILALRKLLEIIEIVWWSSSFVVVVVAHSVAITWRQKSVSRQHENRCVLFFLRRLRRQLTPHTVKSTAQYYWNGKGLSNSRNSCADESTRYCFRLAK